MKFGFLPFGRLKETWEFREEPENLRVLGLYLWRTLLVLALLSLIAAAWVGWQEIQMVTQAERTTQTLTAPPAPLDPKALQAELNAFTLRQENYQSVSAAPLVEVSWRLEKGSIG
jgi:hypothetical protein